MNSSAKYLLLLALFPTFSLAASPPVRALNEAQLSQVAYFDLAALSNSFFHSRIRIRLSEKLFAPSSVSTSTSHSIDDLGNDQETTITSMHGDPISERTVEMEEIDDLGRTVKLLSREKSETRDQSTLPAGKYDFYPSPLLRLSVPVSGSGEITDSSGKRMLVTLDMSMQPAFYFDPEAKKIVQISDPAVEIRATFAFLPEGQNFSDGTMFYASEQAVPESLASFSHCTKPGEQISTSPLVLGPGLLAERIEYCFPTGGNKYERMVLIRKNPPHEPEDIRKRTLESLLNRGGSISKSQIFPMSPANLSFANCHGYAIMGILGAQALPADAYWIQSNSVPTYTLSTQPLEIILKSKFRKVLTVNSDYYNVAAEERLAKDQRLQAGDFITFAGGGGFAHSGIVKRAPDGKSWWIQNKFEEGPVVDMPFASVHDTIPNLYSEIRVYRKL